jgi:hypothetical protein
VQASERSHLFALGLAGLIVAFDGLCERCGIDVGIATALAKLELGDHLGVAAEHDVGAAAGHIRADRDGALAPGLRDDERLALVVLGVEHFMRDAHALQQPGEPLRFFH